MIRHRHLLPLGLAATLAVAGCRRGHVLVETVDPLGRSALGRSEHDAPEVDGHVRVVPIPKGLKPGSFVRVDITAAAGYDLEGRPAPAVTAS